MISDIIFCLFICVFSGAVLSATAFGAIWVGYLLFATVKTTMWLVYLAWVAVIAIAVGIVSVYTGCKIYDFFKRWHSRR